MDKEKKPTRGLWERIVDWWNYSPETLGEQVKTIRRYNTISFIMICISIVLTIFNLHRGHW